MDVISTDRHGLPGGAKPLPKPAMSRDDLRALAVAALRRFGNMHFRTLPGIEYMADDALRTSSTTGTVLEPVVSALNAAGMPTEPTIGAVMNVMGLNPDQLHHGLCHCIYGETITGDHAASNFSAFA